MSMHLVHPSLNSYGKSKRKPNAKQQRAKSAHEEWLRSRGLHPDQIKDKAKDAPKSKAKISTYDARRSVPLSNSVGNGFKRGIMEELHKEPEHVKKEILRKAQRTDSLYSKGPTQYITDGTDITMIGGRSRRG